MRRPGPVRSPPRARGPAGRAGSRGRARSGPRAGRDPAAGRVDKNGKPVKPPKVCTARTREDAPKLAKANQQAAPLLKAAAQLREAADALRAQVAKLTPAQARVVQLLGRRRRPGREQARGPGADPRSPRPAGSAASSSPLQAAASDPAPADRRRSGPRHRLSPGQSRSRHVQHDRSHRPPLRPDPRHRRHRRIGCVAVAPAASAAQPADKGRPAIIDLEHGKLPVFYCDPDKPKQRHNNCIDLDAPTRF